MNNLTNNLHQTWNDALTTQGTDYHASDLLVCIHDTLVNIASPDLDTWDYGAVCQFARRIASQAATWVQGVRPLLLIVDGEWPVTNADLSLWRQWVRFMGCTLDPGAWDDMTGDITHALRIKRRYQAWEGYYGVGVTDEHRRLLSALQWEIDYFRGDWRSIYVDGKRPMGDSARVVQIAILLGWTFDHKEPDGDQYLSAQQEERAWDLFDQLPFALQDVLS